MAITAHDLVIGSNRYTNLCYHTFGLPLVLIQISSVYSAAALGDYFIFLVYSFLSRITYPSTIYIFMCVSSYLISCILDSIEIEEVMGASFVLSDLW